MQLKGENYLLPETFEVSNVLKQLEKKFGVKHEEGSEEEIIYCDSFDWRLFAKQYLLTNCGLNWSLLHLGTENTIAHAIGPRPGKNRFPSEFGTGFLKDILKENLTIRSVLPLASVAILKSELRILNKDEKTVVRVSLEKYFVDNDESTIQVCRVTPVRGYRDEFIAVSKIFKDFELIVKPVQLVILEECLKKQGTHPGDYSSKLNLKLDPDQTARSAAVYIYKTLLEAIHKNIPGTIQDLDSEFLHDLRVAVRRTRSALSLIKNVLPSEVVEQYKNEFAYIGKVTGPVRDLDVYLLDEYKYMAQLPDFLQEGLKAFFDELALQKKEEQKKLVKELQGEKIPATLNSWETYLEGEDELPARLADSPVIDIAKKVINNRYRRVMKDGLAITPITPDQEIHRLRIQGKKLRYAIEFFSSLFPEEDIAKAVKRLKQFQNYLGDFNDLSVQQDMLREHLMQLRPGSRKNQMLGAALGGLLTNLHQEQVKARLEFEDVFGNFAGPKNTDLFEKLFT